MSIEKSKYDVSRDGVISAVRIYYKNGSTPYADLALAYGSMVTIQWTSVEQRREYMSGINGYTLFYDEREKAEFDTFIK